MAIRTVLDSSSSGIEAARAAPILLVVLVAVCASGCTFEDGHGFSRVQAASLEAALEPGAERDLGNHTVKSDLGYAVHLDSATLEVKELALEEQVGGGSGAPGSFDPANPPPGYAFCDNGHCHADDGRLVDYEEVEAELAAGAPSFAPVVTLPVEREIDWLSGEKVALDRVEPSRELPQANVARARVTLARLSATGSVTGGALGQQNATLTFELEGPFSVGATKSWTIDRDADEEVRIDARLVTPGTFFDGIDFSVRVQAGAITLEDEDEDAEKLVAALLESELGVRIE